MKWYSNSCADPRPLPALRSDSQSNLVAANRHPSKGKKAQKPPTKSPTQQSPSHPRGPKAVQNGKISGRTSPVYTYDQYTGRKVLISSSPEDNIQGRNAGREIQKVCCNPPFWCSEISLPPDILHHHNDKWLIWSLCRSTREIAHLQEVFKSVYLSKAGSQSSMQFICNVQTVSQYHHSM